MVTRQQLNMFVRRLVEEFHPRRIILFGSHVRGTPSVSSDVDLLLELSFKGSSLKMAADMLRKTDPPFAVDLIVRTPSQIRRRLAMNDYFIRDAMATGKVLYEAAHT